MGLELMERTHRLGKEQVEKKPALLVLDAQVNMFDPAFHIVDGDRVLAVIGSLVEKAHAAGAQVIYVRNDGGPGEPDERGTPGWEIHPRIEPSASAIVVDKSGPDAFEGTDLQHKLHECGIVKLVIAGMQTELCVDATCRKAAQLGYEVTLAKDGHTTFDWKEISAADAIQKHNSELSAVADVRRAALISFV
jgi:nicotinamidase-related amidase